MTKGRLDLAASFRLSGRARPRGPIAEQTSERSPHRRSDWHLEKGIHSVVTRVIGAIAKPDMIQVVSGLPKTRSGKIMRRILRKVAAGEFSDLGDISTLLNPEVVEEIVKGRGEGEGREFSIVYFRFSR